MKFHPSKCYVMNITTKRKPVKYEYTLMNEHLEHVQSIPYLGVCLNNKLQWNDHVNAITSKANRCLGFIHRNLRQCPMQIKSQAYTALVRPTLEYASAAWDPHHQYQIDQIEMVQRRAARVVKQCWSREQGCVTQALQELNWPSLETRRKHSRLTHIYKAINTDTSTVKIPTYFSQRNNDNTRSTRNHHPQKFINPHTRTNIYKHSFFPRSIREWNALPNRVINSLSIDQFKRVLGRESEV